MEKTLYIHWGPGGNAQAELNAFRDHFSPDFIFWAQPLVSSEPQPYLSLVNATVQEVQRIFDETHSPVSLFAHSFGANLALEVVKRIPEKVAKLTLISALPSVKAAYTHLGALFASFYHDEALRSRTVDFEKNPSFETFMPLFQAVTAHANFMNHFWGTNPTSIAARNAFMKVAETTPILHFETFAVVMKDLFDHFVSEEYLIGLTPPESIPTEIHLGNEDPYFNVDDAARRWQIRIPHARIFSHPAGHFLQVEGKTVWS